MMSRPGAAAEPASGGSGEVTVVAGNVVAAVAVAVAVREVLLS